MRELLVHWAHEGRIVAVLCTLAGVAAFLVVGTVLSVVDAREHRLPRRWVGSLYLLLVPLGTAATLCADRSEALWGGLVGAAAWAVFFGVVRLASPRSMGLGDLRLAPVLGWTTGLVSPAHALAGLLLTFLLAGLWAAALVVARRAGPTTRIAFGPWMLAGTAVAWLLPLRLV